MVQEAKQAQRDSVEAEIAALKARIAELESERKSRPVVSEETRERMRTLRSDGRDELGRILRGLVYAGVEDMRSTADSLRDGLDDYVARLDRRKNEPAESSRDRGQTRTDELAEEIDELMASVATGLDRALQGPGRIVDRFVEEYRKPSDERRSSAKA